MLLRVNNSKVSGRVKLPGSKSHTIRALFIAGLADGTSEINQPLVSGDASSAIEVCKGFGANIEVFDKKYIVKGFAGVPKVPDDIINVGNSGTSLRFAVATAALCEGFSVFTGDYQIRKRPLNPLIVSINDLGGMAVSTRNNGMAPVVVKGRAKGGKTKIDAVTSQYLSSLLINVL